jgi:hypothetical protein
MAAEQSSITDTVERSLSCEARETARRIESLYERASALGAKDREAGWPTPVAWFWEWHNALEAWASRLDALDSPSTP